MKASICTKYGGPEVYKILDVGTPTPSANEILVKVKVAIVSPTDCNFRSGKPFISRLFSGLTKPKKQIHGEMFAGTVEAIGDDVTTFQIGDRVYGTNGMKLGAYAEYVCVDVKEAVKKIPEELSFEHAITLLDGGITALPFLREAGAIQAGDHALINGASGAVGSMGVMIAKHFGATVTGVCGPDNVENVRSLGADHVVNYHEEDYASGNATYDIIFDAVGKSSYAKAKKVLSKQGIYLTTVPTPGLLLGALFSKPKRNGKAGFMAAGLRKVAVKLQDMAHLEQLVINGELKPLIGKRFTLDQLSEAQTYVETGHKVGNVLIEI